MLSGCAVPASEMPHPERDTITTKPIDKSLKAVQEHFLVVLPRIEHYARQMFRSIRGEERKEELIQEVRALAWKEFQQAIERGKDPTAYVSQIALYAAKHARSGRGVATRQRSKEVLSQFAQRRRGFCVESLPICTRQSVDALYADPHGQDRVNEVEERLRDNTQTAVPEQVAFRLDFPAWLSSRTERDRRLIHDLGLSHRTKDLARKYGTTPGRISQLRREYCADWARFAGDDTGDD
jgi:hypothetical protein